MIKIDKFIRKSLYIVSNVKTETLTIIDGLCNTILKDIPIGKRPFKLALKDDNTIAVACDVSNTVSLVNCNNYKVERKIIPNNGNIIIDNKRKRIYVSNTSQIDIYDVDLNILLGQIKGFSAIIDMKLNKDSSKLYILDTLLKELRIYNTESYNLINSFENLGVNSTYLIVSKDDKTVYVSMQHNILKIDINLKIITNLILPKGSFIANMMLDKNILYAANQGLNRIDLINIKTNKAYNYILTSKTEPVRLFITDDNTKLLVVNKSSEDYGSIDIIDLKLNCLIGSILMNNLNSQPYDVISLSLADTYVPTVAKPSLQSCNEEITIIAKKIFAFYNESINFPIININLPNDLTSPYILERIKFEPGIIVQNSELRSSISSESGLSTIKFILRVNYLIDYLQNNNFFSIYGFFEKPIDTFVDIPKERDLSEFNLKIKTTTKLISDPSILDNTIKFGVTTFMELKIIGDDEISIPSLKKPYDSCGEDFEVFKGFEGSIFLDEKNFPV
ncbi:MAG: YncE family protein [Clostridium sp.]|uniref:YncE family protein n=1 Tax=Clostridium sp. TaxID=1506 RepID=UPI003D6CDC39